MTKLGKNFWLFRIAQIISLFGDQLALIAISFYILTKTGSAAKMSFVVAPANFVGLLLTLFLGPFADNFERKKFITLGNFVKFFAWCLIILSLLFNKLSISALCVLYIISAIGGAIINSGSSGFLPELVAKKNIQKAFQAVTGTNSVIKIVSGIFAGAIVSFFGIAFSLTVNALTFLYVSSTTLFIRPQFSISKTRILEEVFKSWKLDFYDGIKYVIKTNKLGLVCLALFFIQFIIVPMQIALPVFVKNHLHESASFLGILLSADGFGAIISAMFLSYLKIKKNHLVLYGFCLSAVSVFCMGIPAHKVFPIFFVTLASLGITSVSITFNTCLMKIIPESYRSRFFTLIIFAEGSAAPLGLLCSGYLIDYFGVMKIFLTMGVSLLFLTCLLNYFGIFNFIAFGNDRYKL